MAFELPTLPYSKSALAAKQHVPGNPGAASRQAPPGLCHRAERLRREEPRAAGQVARGDRQAVARQARHGAGVQQCRPALEPHPVLAEHEPERRQASPARWRSKITADFGDVAKFKDAFKAGRRRPVRLRLGVAGAGLRRQAEGDARPRTAPTRSPPARARRCSAATCGSTATTWISATAARTTCRTGLDKLANYEFAEAQLNGRDRDARGDPPSRCLRIRPRIGLRPDVTGCVSPPSP